MRATFHFTVASLAFLLLLPAAVPAQDPATPEEQPKAEPPPRPMPRYQPPPNPGGRMGRRGTTARTDATLRAERQENLKDAAQLALLAQQLKQEIEKNSALVLPLETVKKTDEIAKLVKKIHDRLVRN